MLPKRKPTDVAARDWKTRIQIAANWDALAEHLAASAAGLKAAADAAGLTVDDLLGAIDEHPVDDVVEWLEDRIDARREREADRGRKNITSTVVAAKVKAAKARKRSPARKWRAEVDTRRAGVTKEAVYQWIANREGLASGSIKKAVLRARRQK